MHLRIGLLSLNFITDDALHRLCVTGPQKLVQVAQAVIDKQAMLLRQARLDRDLAMARANEAIELFASQQARIDELENRLDTILRHPVTGTSNGEGT